MDRRSQTILNNLEGRYSGGAMTGFPDPQVEIAVRNWLSGIHDSFF